MKKLLIIFSFLVFCVSVFSQDFDKRLLLKYSESEIMNLKNNDLNHYKFLVKALDKALVFGDIPSEKEKSFSFDGEMDLDLSKTYNFLQLNLEILDRYQYYKIKGTNKMLVVWPIIFLNDEVLKERTNKTN